MKQITELRIQNQHFRKSAAQYKCDPVQVPACVFPIPMKKNVDPLAPMDPLPVPQMSKRLAYSDIDMMFESMSKKSKTGVMNNELLLPAPTVPKEPVVLTTVDLISFFNLTPTHLGDICKNPVQAREYFISACNES